MQLRYVGGLSSVSLPGVAGTAEPGGTLEVADEDRAARAVATGEWVPVEEDVVPERRERVAPAPQKG